MSYNRSFLSLVKLLTPRDQKGTKSKTEFQKDSPPSQLKDVDFVLNAVNQNTHLHPQTTPHIGHKHTSHTHTHISITHIKNTPTQINHRSMHASITHTHQDHPTLPLQICPAGCAAVAVVQAASVSPPSVGSARPSAAAAGPLPWHLCHQHTRRQTTPHTHRHTHKWL